MKNQALRNNDWLSKKIATIWRHHFADVPLLNTVYVQFGKKAKVRLGSISAGPGGCTIITVSGYMRNPIIPEYVIEAVLAHELCHYAHGFHSPLKQLCRYPHSGGIIRRELRKRGLEQLLDLEIYWLKENWSQIIKKGV